MSPRRWAFTLLAPTQFAFALLAGLALAGAVDGPEVLWPVLAAAGAMSLVGLALAVWGTWHVATERPWVLAGAATALVGHYVVDTVLPTVAPAMVYVGTGLVASIADRRALGLGVAAGAGAVLRNYDATVALGHLVLALAAALLGVVLLRAARQADADDAAAPAANA